MITTEVDDKEVKAVLNRLSSRLSNMAPVMAEIGETLMESTKVRFQTSTAPDGGRWASNAQSTVLSYLRGKGGAISKKTGRITSKGQGYAINKKPLVETGDLADTIRYQVVDGGLGVLIGTNRSFGNTGEVSAAVHQFGTINGRIPARSFLGISASDHKAILGIISRRLTPS